jgi:chromosome segregation ATPase
MIQRAASWASGDVSEGQPTTESTANETSCPTEEEDIQDPLWLEQASALLPSGLQLLDSERSSVAEERRQRHDLVAQLHRSQEKLAAALEDLEVVQEERDELEGACEEAHAQIEEYEGELGSPASGQSELMLTQAALTEARADQAKLRIEVASLKRELAVRNAELLRVARQNSQLVQRLADAGLSTS